ncbi:hypothetical protein L917_06820 [Phytophthora nicotianae]|uniref:Uncharacterized protein n=1 Tax=Phytophthora nicotianae TaxID=4792 RepID=W2LFA7_PHYNI|nr:hypothetical protein L917_06820 [Phytophthora nicotianae]
MESGKHYLEDTCCTKVHYIPSGITGLSLPMDVRVMHSFKNKIQDHVFSRSASERRLLLSHIVGKGDVVDKETIILWFATLLAPQKSNVL